MGIWNQLNTKTIADNPGTEIQVQSNPIHLQEQNRGDFEDIRLINQTTMRDGNPIPATQKVVNLTYSDNVYYDIITPQKGEVWLIQSSWVFTATGFTSGILAILDNVNGNRIYIADWGSGGGDLEDSGLTPLLTVDENCTLQFYPYGTLSSTSTIQTLLTRVR